MERELWIALYRMLRAAARRVPRRRRVRVGDADWSAALAGAGVESAPFRVDELRVIHSQLSPKGSIYTPLVRAPLVGSSAGV